jgi:cell division ATPase FtsA
LDSYIKDSIAGYFEELLERHIPVSVTVQSIDQEVASATETATARRKLQRPKRETLSRILSISALIISLALTGLVVYSIVGKSNIQEKPKIDQSYIDSLLEQKISEAVKDQKFTINLYKMVDTLNVDKSTVQVPAGE